ncbi:MAG: redoxin domain-containing protein [Pyrinomonadaceae bacterium]
MKIFAASILALFAFSVSFAQNEQSPIVEKEITYTNWTFKSVTTGEESSLRDLARGKKLVIVVYYAPWCHNWRHDAPFLQRFYEKYHGKGLEIVGVGEYDPLASMKSNLEFLKISFPVVYESEMRGDKQKTDHYDYRRTTGDMRSWGSPWYILLEPDKFEKKGSVLVKKADVINGEMIEIEGEKYVREKLGLPAVDTKAAVGRKGEIEVCDPDKKPLELKKP